MFTEREREGKRLGEGKDKHFYVVSTLDLIILGSLCLRKGALFRP